MNRYLDALPLTPEQRAVVDEVVRVWADQGKIIEGGWLAYERIAAPAFMPTEAREQARRIFFLGAQHVFASVINMLDAEAEPTERDLERMTKLHEELEAFRRSLGH